MMNNWSQWWQERSQREQTMLGIMMVAILVFLLWFLCIRPVASSLKAERARFDRAVVDLAAVKSKADTLKALRANPVPPLGIPVAAFVAQSASDAGFTLSKTEPIGTDGVVIAMASAKSPALLGWFADLETRGFFVSELSVRPNNDMTVSVDATLKMRAE